MQIVPNSSSLYTLFYSVIYNSVTVLYVYSMWNCVGENIETEVVYYVFIP